MTVYKLHKILTKAIKDGHGRKTVCCNKTTFHDNRESDGVTILPVVSAKIISVLVADDDGAIKINKDGSERWSTRMVLKGGL